MTAIESSAPLVFLRSLLRNPLSIGAVAPSSPHLSRLVASSVSTDHKVIVEVGAGTGSITSALLDRGIHPHRLTLIERDSSLAGYLQERFPRVRVRCGDAFDTAQLLDAGEAGNVDVVLSSLPIRNFKPADQERVIEAMTATLGPGGQLIQYTYAPNCPIPASKLKLNAECLGRVWWNLPPAAVWRFTKV